MIDHRLTLASAEEGLGIVLAEAVDTFDAAHPFVVAEKAREAGMGLVHEQGGYTPDAVNEAASQGWGGTAACAFLRERLHAADAATVEEIIYEAVGNAIEHGTRFGEMGAVTLRLRLSATALLIHVEQPGSGFAYEEAVDLRTPHDAVRGYGLPYLDALAADVGFERVAGEVARFRTLVLYALTRDHLRDAIMRLRKQAGLEPDEGV